jgi:hypothetical protein
MASPTKPSGSGSRRRRLPSWRGWHEWGRGYSPPPHGRGWGYR